MLTRKKLCLGLLLASTIYSSHSFAFDAGNSDFSFDNRFVDAVNSNNSEIVKALIANGEDVNETGKFETSALHRAVFNDNIEMINLLLKSNADINIRDYGGTTPLHIAARQGLVDAATVLVSKGADINAVDDQGFTALHRAVSYDKSDVSMYLIAQGADINTANNEGNTPLIDAVKVSDPLVVKELLVKGADKKAKNNKGLDAFDYAIKMGNSMVDSILSKSGAELQQDAIDNNSAIPAFLKTETAGSAVVKTDDVKIDDMSNLPFDAQVPLSMTPQAKMAGQGNFANTAEIQSSEQQSLQKAPRLPAGGSIPEDMKAPEKPAFSKKPIASQAPEEQITQVTTVTTIPLNNDFEESRNNDVIPLGNPAEPASITYARIITPENAVKTPVTKPVEHIEVIPVQTTRSSSNVSAPVSDEAIKAPRLPAETKPAQETSVKTAAEPAKAQKIDWNYAAEVDSIFDSLGTAAPAKTGSTPQKKTSDSSDDTARQTAVATPVVSSGADYDKFKSNLSDNINEYYNSKPAQDTNSTIEKTLEKKPSAAPEDIKTQSRRQVKPAATETATQTETPRPARIEIAMKTPADNLPVITPPPAKKISSKTAALNIPNSLNIASSAGDNNLNGPHSIIGNFEKGSDAVNFYNVNSSRTGIVYNYKVVKSGGRFALAIGRLENTDDAKGLCEGFATAEHPCTPITAKDAPKYDIIDVKKVYAQVTGFKDESEAENYFKAKSASYSDNIEYKTTSGSKGETLQLGPVASGMDAKKLCDSFSSGDKACSITVK